MKVSRLDRRCGGALLNFLPLHLAFSAPRLLELPPYLFTKPLCRMNTIEDFPRHVCYSFRLWLWSWPVKVTYTPLRGEEGEKLARFEFWGMAISKTLYSCREILLVQMERSPYATAGALAWELHRQMQQEYPYIFQNPVEIPPYWGP